MQLLEHLARQYAHDDWANRETLASLAALDAPPAQAVELLGHVIGAGELWLARLTAPDERPAVWPRLELAACGRRLDDLAVAWRRVLSSLGPDDLARDVEYVNSRGEPWTSTVLDVLAHVPLHATYHRGQIAAALARAGATPAYTDYIHGARNGLW